LGKYRVQLLIGGSNIEPDKQAFKDLGANFIIATPGKLKEMLNAQTEGFTFKNLNLFVMGNFLIMTILEIIDCE